MRSSIAFWLKDGDAQGWSKKNLRDREEMMERFCWWVEHEAQLPDHLSILCPDLIRRFLSYARDPHPTGRYGSSRESARRQARPATVNAYFRNIRAFTNFCKAEGLLRETPLRNVKAPKIPKDEIEPFSERQLQQLLDACRRGKNPERDTAILLLLVDSGMRVSELVGLTIGHINRSEGKLTVLGKGNKERSVAMGVTARRALWRYLEHRMEDEPCLPLFVATGGHRSGCGLTADGVRDMLARAGQAALIRDVRCSPHTCRHTFAINFLRNGGNVLELQRLLGHEDIGMLQRYVKLAQVDVERAHRTAGPVDRMKLR